MFGVYEVSKADGALVLGADAEAEAEAAAEVEVATEAELVTEVELLDLVCFMSSSALTSRSNCSVN